MDGDGEDANPGELPDEGEGDNDPVVPASRPVTSVPVRPRTTAGGRPLTSRGRPATSRPGTLQHLQLGDKTGFQKAEKSSA